MERACADPIEKEVADFLQSPASYDERPEKVVAIETHAARVFLAGSKAYKVKKHVKLPFLDFTSLVERQRVLLRELELNRPYAGEIYLDVLAIGKDRQGHLAFGEGGEVVDYALLMNRFDEAAVLSRIAAAGPLPPKLARALADMVADYHRGLKPKFLGEVHQSSADTVRDLIAATASADDILGRAARDRFASELSRELAARTVTLAARAVQGCVRRCHGDLHLGNIVVCSGRPVPFDALEFDENLATIDVLYDLCFLLMDLEFHGDRRASNMVFNRYVSAAPEGHEIAGLALLPLFLAMRATVLAVVSIARHRQLPEASRDSHASAARAYMQSANEFLRPSDPCLVAVGGLSGTGKSTLATALAPHLGSAPGALHLRSDVERKRLFGVSEQHRLPPEYYIEAVSKQVYDTLLSKAGRCLEAGHAVIVDAVAAKAEERRALAALAARHSCSFVGLWLEAPVRKLVARVEARRGDASDADRDVVHAQASYDLGEMDWHRIEAGGTPDETLGAALDALQTAGAGSMTASWRSNGG